MIIIIFSMIIISVHFRGQSNESSKMRQQRLGGGDSKSTSRLHSTSAHRSMTRLNTGMFYMYKGSHYYLTVAYLTSSDTSD